MAKSFETHHCLCNVVAGSGRRALQGNAVKSKSSVEMLFSSIAADLRRLSQQNWYVLASAFTAAFIECLRIQLARFV